MGTNSKTGEIYIAKTLAGQEKIVRDGKNVTVYATMVRSHINPERITVNKGEWLQKNKQFKYQKKTNN